MLFLTLRAAPLVGLRSRLPAIRSNPMPPIICLPRSWLPPPKRRRFACSGLLAALLLSLSSACSCPTGNCWREALRQIFDDPTLTTPAAGAAQLAQWSVTARALGLTAVNQFCDMLDRWQDKIANYFLSRASNGPTEGFNNGLRTLLRRTYGMTNFHRFRLRVLDRFGHPQPQEST